jgi:hypothetical protein
LRFLGAIARIAGPREDIHESEAKVERCQLWRIGVTICVEMAEPENQFKDVFVDNYVSLAKLRYISLKNPVDELPIVERLKALLTHNFHQYDFASSITIRIFSFLLCKLTRELCIYILSHYLSMVMVSRCGRAVKASDLKSDSVVCDMTEQ